MVDVAKIEPQKWVGELVYASASTSCVSDANGRVLADKLCTYQVLKLVKKPATPRDSGLPAKLAKAGWRLRQSGNHSFVHL